MRPGLARQPARGPPGLGPWRARARGPALPSPPPRGPAVFFPPLRPAKAPPRLGPSGWREAQPPQWLARSYRLRALGSCPTAAAPRWGPPVSLRGVAPCSSSLSHERAFFSFPRANRSPDASLSFPIAQPRENPRPCTWPRHRRSSR